MLSAVFPHPDSSSALPPQNDISPTCHPEPLNPFPVILSRRRRIWEGGPDAPARPRPFCGQDLLADLTKTPELGTVLNSSEPPAASLCDLGGCLSQRSFPRPDSSSALPPQNDISPTCHPEPKAKDLGGGLGCAGHASSLLWPRPARGPRQNRKVGIYSTPSPTLASSTLRSKGVRAKC